MNASFLPALDIFRAGTHTDVGGRTLNFAAADLARTAAAYDPAKHEAPLVVGHPALDAPAYGWVRFLEAAGDTLRALPDQVEPQFAAMVNAGRFKKISASFWLPDAPGNPAPGAYSLRHVGFLGAAAPAVKGLRAPQFAADEAGTITLEFADPGEENPSMPAIPPKKDPPVSEPIPDYVALAAELTRREAALVERETALAKAEADRALAAAAAFAEAQVRAGKILPRQQAGLTRLLFALPAAPLEFAEDGQTVRIEPRAWLETFLADLPERVDYAERTPAEPKTPAAAPVLRRADFEALSPERRVLHVAAGGTIVD